MEILYELETVAPQIESGAIANASRLGMRMPASAVASAVLSVEICLFGQRKMNAHEQFSDLLM